MEITRKEKRAAILAFCGEVTRGYSTPRGSGFCTITCLKEASGDWYLIEIRSIGISRVVDYNDYEHLWGDTDFLYCILGLEARAVMDYMEANFAEMTKQMQVVNQDLRSRLEPLLEAAQRVCNESMADYAVTTQGELGVLSEGFEKALGQLQEIVDQYEK